uniref:Retrovirus-related Pol polyprotein from transposon TNT 1-94 n=1 Tax=Tanacetum cinerariifolium TaxID=118510 RepID=A0A699GPP9_TANCI|nr:hypothetical protein [Tanacetum cinerariifolium]
MRIVPTKTKKEPTYQVVLDTLALSTCYQGFLITADDPEIYMQQFWFTISKIKDSSSYQFKLDKKKCRIGVEVFHDILQICPRLPNQEFVEPLFDEEIVSFIKELGYKGDLGSVRVPDDPKRKCKDTSEGAGSKPKVPDVSADQESDDESWVTMEKMMITREYNRINEEIYNDVNVNMKDVELADEGKGDVEMIDVIQANVENIQEKRDTEHVEINQEVEFEKIQDEAEATTIAPPPMHKGKTDAPSSSSSHSVPSNYVLDVSVSIIPKPSVIKPIPQNVQAALATTILPIISLIFPIHQQTTPIPTPTNTKATTSTTTVLNLKPFMAIHLRVSDLEKEVKELRSVDHSSVILIVIKSEVPLGVKEYLGTSLEDDLNKKRKLDDEGRDEDPPVRSDQGLKKRKTRKDAKPAKRSKSTEEEAPTENIRRLQPRQRQLRISHWGPKRQSFYGYLSKKVSKHGVYSTKRILAVTNVKVNKWYGYGHLEETEVRRANQQLYKFMEGDFPRLHLNDIKDVLILVVQNRLFNLKGDVIVDLTVVLHMFTRRIVIQKRVEDLQLGVESYQKKLNITRPKTFKTDISNLVPYTAYSNPRGVIYVYKLNRNRLMRTDELYKFSDGTLTSVRDILHDIATNFRME